MTCDVNLYVLSDEQSLEVIKQSLRDIQLIIDAIKLVEPSRAMSLAITKLDESRHWLTDEKSIRIIKKVA